LACAGAIDFIYSQHHYVNSYPEAVALALNAGTDIDCGTTYPQYLGDAIAAGLTNESMLDASLRRTLTLQFDFGRFDPLASQPYTQIGLDVIDSPAHQQLAFDAATQGMVLLRNDAGVLPLRTGAGVRIAVIGPHGNSTRDLLGSYFESRCPGPADDYDCVPTIYSALTAANAGGTVTLTQGCDMVNASEYNVTAAVAAAQAADIVVLAIGINDQVESEGMDRTTIALPGAQGNLSLAVLAVGKPTVVLLLNGGTLGVDAIAAWPVGSLAIVEVFFPGESGGVAIAAQLTGAVNRWGKLPITMFSLSTPLSTTNFSMTAAPGRSYKYYTGKPLWPFGWGLSYTTFGITGAAALDGGSADGPLTLTRATDRAVYVVTVNNTGSVAGDEVVQVFVSPAAPRRLGYPVPGSNDTAALQVLVGFERVTLSPGQSTTVTFNVTASTFADVDGNGDRVLRNGAYRLFASTGPQRHVVDVAVALPEGALVLRRNPLRGLGGGSPARHV